MNAKIKSIFKNKGALCKVNCHPLATVHFCTRHHCTVLPKLLSQKLDSAKCPLLVTNRIAQLSLLAYRGILLTDSKYIFLR